MLKRLLLTAILTIVTAAANASTLDEAFDRTFDVRPGAVFALTNTNGHITVRSWDSPRIKVHAVKHVESRDGDAARAAMKALTFALSQPNGGLRIDTKYPKSSDGIFEWIAGTSVNLSVTYEVFLPRTMDLQIENTNGTIEASDVRGSHRIETTNGQIKLVRCSGDLNAETTNGGIEAELTAVTKGRVVRLETTNGNIHARLPRTLAASLDASTTNGGIDSDLPVATRGNLSKHSLRGTINGGGADLHMRTTNGSIHIQAM
ncbi:MAG: hypothetical protein QOC81_5118 [Thermoanaerobaculia bacterium]|jgi:DUF4097 and DUF4098 domain-containing protein YvlB|nr:hypothetical protein [Thermoanaerobaculia bacterium]